MTNGSITTAQGRYMDGELIANHLEHISKKYIDNHLEEYCSNLLKVYFEVQQAGMTYEMRITNAVNFPC